MLMLNEVVVAGRQLCRHEVLNDSLFWQVSRVRVGRLNAHDALPHRQQNIKFAQVLDE